MKRILLLFCMSFFAINGMNVETKNGITRHENKKCIEYLDSVGTDVTYIKQEKMFTMLVIHPDFNFKSSFGEEARRLFFKLQSRFQEKN